MEPKIFLLTAGDYDDYSVLGVFIGTEMGAHQKALQMTGERAYREFPHNVPSDLIKVSVEPTEVLS